jgi:TPR repeat protein
MKTGPILILWLGCLNEGIDVPSIDLLQPSANVQREEQLQRLLQAANRGDADAQNALGVAYDDGDGVAQDSARALEWYRKAAEQGHAAAQNNLAFMYEVGRGVSLDYDEALRWYRRSAEQGWPAAQVSLGLMYAGAAGVERDFTEALTWFEIAAALASGEEREKYAGLRDAIEPKMTPERIAAARQRAQEWLREFNARRSRP